MQSKMQGVPRFRLPDKTRRSEDSRMVTHDGVAKCFHTEQSGVNLEKVSRGESPRPRLQEAS